MQGLTENTTIDTSGFPAIAQGAPERVQHNRDELFAEYRSLLLMNDDDVQDEHKQRFAEVCMMLAIEPAQIARDAAIVGKVRELERKVAAGERWDRKAAEIREKIHALKSKDTPAYDRLQSDLRTAETRASLASRLRVELNFAKRGSKRAAQLYGEPTIEESRRGPLPSGAVRLG